MSKHGVPITPDERADQALAPNQSGTVWATPAEGGFIFDARTKTNLSTEDLLGFEQWLDRAIDQLLETGDPRGNGWYPGELSEGWHLTCAQYELPDLGEDG